MCSGTGSEQKFWRTGRNNKCCGGRRLGLGPFLRLLESISSSGAYGIALSMIASDQAAENEALSAMLSLID